MLKKVKGWKLPGILASLALGLVSVLPAQAATSVYPDGPDGGDDTYENSNGLFSENRQLDYDFLLSIFDEYIPLLLPTWNSGGTPLWSTVTHQQNPKLYGPYDNNNNGIRDHDHLDALAAVVNGGAAAATGVGGADISAIQSAFNANRARVKTRELYIPRATITAFGFLTVSVDNVRTGANLTVAGNNIYVPSLWTEVEIANSGNGVNGTTTDFTKKGLLGDAAGMLEVVLRDYIAGQMTLVPAAASNEVTHLQSFMQVFITEFMKTQLPAILANAGTVTPRPANNYNTFDVDLDVDAGGSIGTIRVRIAGQNTGGGAQHIQQGITFFKNSFSPNNVSTTWSGAGFGSGTPPAPPAWTGFTSLGGGLGSLAASGDLNRNGTSNSASYTAASQNRQNFMQAEGITVKPLQFLNFPATINGFAGTNLTIGDDEFTIIAGDGTAKAYDWETVETDGGTVPFTTYSHTDPVLGGTTSNATYTFTPVSLGDNGKKITMQVADDTWTRIVPAMVLNITDPAPTVSGISVLNAQTVRVTFSEAVATGATTVTNYVVSGTGKGSFANNPSSAVNQGGGVVDLTWNAPQEMFNGGNLTVTVSNVQDTTAQTIASPNSGSCTGCAIGTAPTVSTIVSQNPGPSNAATINYTVTFSESVTNVLAGNFTVQNVSGTAAGSVTGISGTGNTRTVTVGGPITGDGELRLNLSTAAGITDAAGNVLSNTLTGGISLVDRVAPAAPTGLDLIAASDSNINNDDVTNDNTPTINGNRDTNTSVQLTSSISGNIGSVVSGGTGTWSITTATLPDGVHTITATSTDGVGNVSAASLPLVITIDTVAPAAPSAPDLLAAFDAGISNTDNVTNLTTLDFQGTRENNTSVTMSSNGTGSFNVAPLGSGAWTVTGSTLQANFTHNVRATATDLAGNTSPQSGLLAVTVDTAAPTIQSTIPVALANVAAVPQVQITFNESVSGVAAGDLTVGGSAATAVSGSGAGAYTFTGYAPPADNPALPIALASGAITDTAGNAFAGDSYTVNKNNAAVTVDLTATGLLSGGITNQTSIAFTATFSQDVTGFIASDVTRLNCNINTFVQVNPQTYTFNIVPTAQGTIQVSVGANVATGPSPAFNPNQASPVFSFTFDSLAPQVTTFLPLASSPTNLDTLVYVVQFNSPVVDFDDPTDIIVFPNGTLALSGFDIIQNSPSNYTVEFNDVTGDGNFLAQIVAGAAKDAAGNNSGSGLSTLLVVDNTPPSLSVDTLATADSTPELTGEITTLDDANVGVTVTVNGQVNFADVDTLDWTLADNTLLPLPDGTYDVQVQATDAAGNTGFDSTTNELTVDANPPIITLIGSNFVSVNCGDGYVDEGFTAFDAVDLDVTGDVNVSISIPFNTPPGIYEIEYTVSDTAGNSALETRTVEVLDNCPLAVTAVGDTFFDLQGGDNATLEIAVSGAIGSFDIQWYRDNDAKAPVLLPGEDQETLNLVNVGASQDAEYYAVVTDDVTSVTSPTFTVVVFIQTPLAGLAGLSVLSALAAVAGASALRRRKQ